MQGPKWSHAFGCIQDAMHECRDLSNNSISGSLPAGWGAAGVYANLVTLKLEDNMLTGATRRRQPSSTLKIIDLC